MALWTGSSKNLATLLFPGVQALVYKELKASLMKDYEKIVDCAIAEIGMELSSHIKSIEESDSAVTLKIDLGTVFGELTKNIK